MPNIDLEKITKQLIKDSFLTPKVATEIEFYLSGEESKLALCMKNIEKECKKQNIAIDNVKEETGENQFEVALDIETPKQSAENTIRLKEIIEQQAKDLGLEASFNAKPYDNQPGNGLHVHISMHNEEGENLYKKNIDDQESEILLYSVGGLCDAILESIVFLAPNEDSYKRFTSKYNTDVPEDEPMRAYNNAPVNVSWSGNNRTSAIRIPTSTISPLSRRVEYRVAGSDADPKTTIALVLAGIHHGLVNKITPPEKTFGNAFDDQYDLPPFPKSLEEAQKVFEEGKVIKGYLDGC